MLGKMQDLTGKRYGRWKVISFSHKDKGNYYWMCECECSNEKLVLAANLRQGKTKSCGCLSIENKTIHGYSTRKNRSPEYNTWLCMRDRCNNKNNDKYEDYGGRGIKVCKEWDEFEVFLNDMGFKPTNKHSLDRINVNGNYKKSNCQWADWSTQCFNRRKTNKNTSGVVGVTFIKRSGKFGARIDHNGKSHYLGNYDTLEEAKQARQEAELKYYGRTLEN